ncbi:hypothetical protein [Tannerella forsythia]|uniref:Uncharacterized protein n=1 Tax=Tannerella forsythia TaxID=28112 RepID=A0A3P1XET3_TANFO|nr:hypothetical protein [Tannerella forsythia]RRD56638.1 hypothetical protein EII40_13625 [Tannerella forsythia]
MALHGAKNFAGYLPANFDTTEFERDVTLIRRLWAVRVPLAAHREALHRSTTIFYQERTF